MDLQTVLLQLSKMNFNNIEMSTDDEELKLYISGTSQHKGDSINITLRENKNYDLAIFIHDFEVFFHDIYIDVLQQEISKI